MDCNKVTSHTSLNSCRCLQKCHCDSGCLFTMKVCTTDTSKVKYTTHVKRTSTCLLVCVVVFYGISLENTDRFQSAKRRVNSSSLDWVSCNCKYTVILDLQYLYCSKICLKSFHLTVYNWTPWYKHIDSWNRKTVDRKPLI